MNTGETQKQGSPVRGVSMNNRMQAQRGIRSTAPRANKAAQRRYYEVCAILYRVSLTAEDTESSAEDAESHFINCVVTGIQEKHKADSPAYNYFISTMPHFNTT